MRVRALAVAAAAALAAVPLGAVAAQAGGGTTTVTVVHGIPGVLVDVYVNEGEAPAFAEFEFGDITEAPLPPGEYFVEVKASPSEPDDDNVVAESFTVGTDPVTIVAQLDADGVPALVAYPDDFSPAAAGSGRVTVRHAAAAPAVDLVVDGTVVGTLENGEQFSAELPAGTYEVEVRVSGTDTVVDVLSPGPVDVVAGEATIAYAVGSLEDETLELLVETGIVIGEDQPTPSATTTTSASATTTTTTRIPTAVPAGDGSAGWSGPLALPAILALSIGAVVALAVTFAVRGTAGSRR
jgi:hypothetical protein